MDKPTSNRGRRVTDQRTELFDSAHQALKLQGLQHAQEMLQANVSQSMAAFRSSVDTIQLDVRQIGAKFEQVLQLQSSQEASRETLDRLESAMAGFRADMVQMLREHDARNDSWRREHEAENERDKAEQQKETRALRERMIWSSGTVAGFSVLASVLGAVMMYALSQRFDALARSIQDLRAEYTEYRGLTEVRYDERVKKIHQIELYLSRGGERRDDPYVAPDQRKTER